MLLLTSLLKLQFCHSVQAKRATESSIYFSFWFPAFAGMMVLVTFDSFVTFLFFNNHQLVTQTSTTGSSIFIAKLSKKSSETSLTFILSSALSVRILSSNIVIQYGQAVAKTDAPVASASSILRSLKRSPLAFSIHSPPPPPPQHILCSRFRSISTNSIPRMALSTYRV